MGGERPLGIGLVGTGGWATSFWQEAQRAPEVLLVAGWDPDAERLSQFADSYGCEMAPTFEGLLANPRVEAVAIFTPNNFHRAPAEAAAAAGKHVFTEKPIANTIPDAAAMIRACQRAGVTLMVGHSARYRGPARALKSLLEEGRLGQVVMAEANISHSGGRRLTEAEWRWHREEAPGGPLMQLSVHAFDTLHYLFGPTRRATALSTSSLSPSQIEDVFLALLEFESGLLAYVGTNYLCPPVNYVRIYGVAGNVHSEGPKVTFLKAAGDWDSHPEGVPVREISAPAAEMAELARAARAHGHPETGGKEGLLALGVAWACLLSAEQGCAVEVRQALGEATALAT
jgi:predicted dehydrogenase